MSESLLKPRKATAHRTIDDDIAGIDDGAADHRWIDTALNFNFAAEAPLECCAELGRFGIVDGRRGTNAYLGHLLGFRLEQLEDRCDFHQAVQTTVVGKHVDEVGESRISYYAIGQEQRLQFGLANARTAEKASQLWIVGNLRGKAELA